MHAVFSRPKSRKSLTKIPFFEAKISSTSSSSKRAGNRRLVVRCCKGEEEKAKRRSFLSLEEAGLVEISGLSTHERFLCD
ncbi:hypothetical protein DsansV1_C26g0194811 [Dioscorea sansibarensis]